MRDTLSTLVPAAMAGLAIALLSATAAYAEGPLQPVPEPSAVVGLLSMGVVGLLLYVWRRRRRGG